MADCEERERMLTAQQDLTNPSLGLTQHQFDNKYGRIKEPDRTCRQEISHLCSKHCKCSRTSCIKYLLDQFPLVEMIRTYEFRDYILGDLISGVSLGVMNIPQSLGYALLATVPPIHGMYTAFFAPLIYVIFGTSRHIAMGVMALSSLLIADVVKKHTLHLHQQIEESSGNDTLALAEALEQEAVDIAGLVTILCGVVSLLMGVCGLGFITDYMGDAFVSGWLTGANIRVITSQVIQLLQLKLPTHLGPLNYFYTVYDIAANITQANVASIVIAIVSFAFLLPVKYGINVKFRSKLKVPIPIDLIVVSIAIIACYFGDFKEKYGVRQVDHIPTGLPTPRLPPLEKTFDVLLDACLLALVGYVLGYMMVKVFSDKYNYTVSSNQELKALGYCNIFGGIFSTIACSTSPPRCFFMEQTGGKSQLANVLSSVITLMFLFFAGPLLEPMPICVLNALIITACIPIFEYYKRCVIFWQTNKYDFAIWLVSAAATLGLDVNMGIVIGMSFSLLTVVFRTQRPYSGSVSVVEDSHVLVASSKYTKYLKETHGVKLFGFSSPLYFATLDMFKRNLFAETVNPSDINEHQMGLVNLLAGFKDNKQPSDNQNGNIPIAMEEGIDTPLTERKDNESSLKDVPSRRNVKLIIVDCSGISFADTAGVKLLSQLWVAYSNVGVKFAVAGCNDQMRGQFVRTLDCREMWNKAVYPSVHDAYKKEGMSEASSQR